jgi:hypothetical protein
MTSRAVSILLFVTTASWLGCDRPETQKVQADTQRVAEQPPKKYEPMPIHRVNQFSHTDPFGDGPEEPKTVNWIAQSADYLRNELPFEFLRSLQLERFENVRTQSEIYKNLGNGRRAKKHLVILRTLSKDLYGYAVYDSTSLSAPLHRGRFADEREGSFMWFDGRGADSESFGTIGGERFHNVTKIPGLDIDVIALDASAQKYIDQGSALRLRGYSKVAPHGATLGGGPLPVNQFCKFYITNGGAPDGQVRYLYWGALNSMDWGELESTKN